MMETNAILGGEESGGYAFRGHIPERDGILSGLMMASMIVDYGLPLSGILAHLEDLVGPHAYDRHDIRFPRDGYEERKEQIYARMQQNEPDNARRRARWSAPAPTTASSSIWTTAPGC